MIGCGKSSSTVDTPDVNLAAPAADSGISIEEALSGSPLKLASSWFDGNVTFAGGVIEFKRKFESQFQNVSVEETFSVGSKTFEKVHLGEYHAGLSLPGYINGNWLKERTEDHPINALVPLFGGKAFGMCAKEFALWMKAEGNDLFNQMMEDVGLNVVGFPVSNTGLQPFGWSSYELPDSLEALKEGQASALNYRCFGDSLFILKSLGINAIAKPGGEIYSLMESGEINAYDWIGVHSKLVGMPLSIVEWYQFIADKILYLDPFGNPSEAFYMLFNKDFFNGLTLETQNNIKNMCYESYDLNHDVEDSFAFQEIKNLASMLNKNEIAGLKRLPNTVLRDIFTASTTYYSDLASKNPYFETVYTDYLSFMVENVAEITSANYTQEEWFAYLERLYPWLQDFSA